MCEIIEHNDFVINTKELIVPYISSDSYVIFNEKIIHSYAKRMPFSELLAPFYYSAPNVYDKVYFRRKPFFDNSPDYNKVFY